MLTSDVISSRDRSRSLLRRAVERKGRLTIDRVLERMFSLSFGGLVYAQIWEDPEVDLAALEVTSTSRIVTIASGGCNVLSYLTADPERIFAVDINRAHVALTRLKLSAAQSFPDHGTFFRFFGQADSPQNAEAYRIVLATGLDAETRSYWEGRDRLGRSRIRQFTKGFYRRGLLGRFIALAHAAARLHGVDPRRLMLARTRTEQERIFATEIAPLFDRPLIKWALGHRAALYGLGIPPAQYEALIGDANHMKDVVSERLRRLATGFDLGDNYFTWAAFNRGYCRDPDGTGPLPPYLQRAHFEDIKRRAGRVSVHLDSFTEFLKRQPAASLDRYVLLDAQDWMRDEDLGALWGEITRTARPGSRVLFRTAGKATILPGRVPAPILAHWRYEEQRSQRYSLEDRSAIYGGVHLYILSGTG